MAQARFSVRTAVAEGFEFWRLHWRKAAGPLALAGVGATLASFGTVGSLFLGAGLEFVALILAHAVFYRIALADLGAEPASVNGPLGFQWGRLEGRLLAVNLLVAAIFAVLIFICAFFTLTLLAGASQDTPLPVTKGVVVSPQQLMDMLSKDQKTAVIIGFFISMIALLLVWARLSMAAATTAARNGVYVLSSIPMTRGSTLRLAGLWLLVRLPVFILAVLAEQFGKLVGDPTTGALAMVFVGLIGVFFVQPILTGALAHVYRRLAAGAA